MTVNYDSATDTLTVILCAAPVAESDEDKSGVILDYDYSGNLVFDRGAGRLATSRGAPVRHSDGVRGGRCPNDASGKSHFSASGGPAVAELKRDPSQPLRVTVSDVDVEMRLVRDAAMKAGADVLNGATWHGESPAELIQIIRDGCVLSDPPEAAHL